jgi:hypothetical protein
MSFRVSVARNLSLPIWLKPERTADLGSATRYPVEGHTLRNRAVSLCEGIGYAVEVIVNQLSRYLAEPGGEEVPENVNGFKGVGASARVEAAMQF